MANNFKKFSDNQKKKYLLSCLVMALKEPEDLKRSWKTDIYGIAAQYGKSQGIKKKDFELIKNITIEDLMKDILLIKNEIS